MEKQMRAERDRRAAILTAEGEKQAADPHRRGRQAGGGADAPRASARPRSCAPRAKRRRSTRSSRRSTRANPTATLLSYEYLQMLPQLAEGDANKVFVVPSEFAAGVRRHRRGARARGADGAAAPHGAGAPRRRRRPTALRRAGGPRAARAARRLRESQSDVRLARRETAGDARRRPPARHADRAGRRRRDARDPPRAARGGRELQGRARSSPRS